MPVSKKDANHVIGRICGVTEGESKIEATRKVIEVMRSAGMSTKKVEKMLAEAIARGVK